MTLIGISGVDLSSEDLELTHLLCESLLVSDTQLNPGGEEAALNACSRLRLTVDTLLDLLNQANTQVKEVEPCHLPQKRYSTKHNGGLMIVTFLQLEQTHNVHLSLEERFSQGREDSAQLLEQHMVLLEQLDQEAKLKSQLQLELHKAEGEHYICQTEPVQCCHSLHNLFQCLCVKHFKLI